MKILWHLFVLFGCGHIDVETNNHIDRLIVSGEGDTHTNSLHYFTLLLLLVGWVLLTVVTHIHIAPGFFCLKLFFFVLRHD